MYVFECSSPSSLKPGKTRHSIPREIPRNGNQIRAVTSQERTPHSIPREIPRNGNQIRSVTSLERTLHAIAPWEAQLSIPAKGDRPCPPLLRRSAPPKVPGLPAASGGTPRASKGRQPLDFPLSSQCRRWSEWNSEGSNAKITPKFKLLCRNDCILLSVERPSLVAM